MDTELKTIEQLFSAEGIRVYKPGEENVQEHYTSAQRQASF
jgi:hypothetical protein